MKFTLIFVVLSLVALSYAIPSPRVPRELKRAAVSAAPENAEDLKDGEKDLEGSESAYHGYYGWPGYYGYPSYSYYTSAYWPYAGAYRPYSYWW